MLNTSERSWENTKRLIERSQNGDMDARTALVNENTPLVKSLVKRYLGRGAEYDDLFQIGIMGLLKAISGFDATFNVRLSTYAVPMINGELKRYVRDGGIVKMPRSLKEMQQKIRACRSRLSTLLGREPGTTEIADALGVPIDDVLFALESMNPCISLDEPLANDAESTVMDTLEDKHDTPSLIDKLALKQCISQLDEREKKIIILRFVKNYTQTRVGEIMGISQVQISRIETRTIEKLRKKLG